MMERMRAWSLPRSWFLLWLAGCLAAAGYAHLQEIPPPVAIPAALAFLVELTLYLEVRRLAALPAAWVWASALAPYLVLSLWLGSFAWQTAGWIALLSAAAVGWFAAAGRGARAELLFLALMGGVYLAKPFRMLYPYPLEGLRVDALGQLMWIRIGIASLLRHRDAGEFGFGFRPSRSEWLVGARYFLLFLPLGAALAVGLRFSEFRLAGGWWWKAPATFVGILWVVGLAEELFFRGLLQQRLTQWWGATAGVAAASAAFGLAHLGFREFPNWKMALLAAVAGAFYGMAFLKGRAVRASMVTHALVVTTWRTLFP